MNFAYPYLLLLAALGLPVFAAAWWRRRGSVAVPTGAGLAAIRPTWRIRLARALPLCRVAAIALLAIALARPRIGEANAVIPAEGIDIALSMDVSSSMTSEMPGAGARGRSKLEVTKSVIRDFIKGRENDRIGFVVFQKDALALTPPTLDYEALDSVVAQTDTGILPDGTGIGVGLASALNMVRDSNAASRIVILLTDGEHNATSISPEDAGDFAAALKIRVYIIGLVDDDALVPQGIDEERMTALAERTGGRYYAADSPTALTDVYDEIGSLETSRVGKEELKRYDEYATWFAVGAACLLAIEFVLGATWLRRSPL